MPQLPEIQPFNLGNVLMTAETIKGMKRQAETDRLRDAYLGVQTRNAEQAGQIAQAENQRAAQAAQQENQVRQAKQMYLLSDSIERAENPQQFVEQFAPEFIQRHDAKNGAGAFSRLTPEQIKREASGMKQHFASVAGIALNGTPEQQFAATQAKNQQAQQFSNQKELAAIQHKYSLAEIGAKAAADSQKTNAANDHKTFKDIQSMRKEFEGMDSVKNFRAVLPLYDRAKNAPNTRAGDISIVYALGKMFDPTSVVRESEVVLAKDAAPWLQKLVGSANSQITGKGALSPEVRADIMQALQGQVDSFRQPYEQERQRFSSYATENGWRPDQVVGQESPANAFQASGDLSTLSDDELLKAINGG